MYREREFVSVSLKSGIEWGRLANRPAPSNTLLLSLGVALSDAGLTQIDL